MKLNRIISFLLAGLFLLVWIYPCDAHRRKHHRAYGVIYDESTSTPTLERIGQGMSAPAAAKLPDNLMALQSAMKGCLQNDAGVVQYYTGATDRTIKENGDASVLTGADGQVMVEIPLGWLKYWYDGTEHHWLISKEQFNGAERLGAFYKNGVWVDNRYIGAYEGIGYDNSTSAYFDGDDAGNNPATNWPGGTAIDTANDKLGSVSGFAPLANETRAEFRAIAGNRGTGWRQQDFSLVFAVQLLYLTEYASFDSQSMIGMGRTELTGGTWAKGSYIKETGLSNGDGNGTNAVAYSGDADDVGAEAAYMTYRGIENFFGNVWKWVDGFNINGGIPYVSNDDTDFADDTATGAASTYSRLKDINGDGITLPQGSNDYQKNLEQTKNGILPSVLVGSSSTYITDYYYQAPGWRVAKLGGAAAHALAAGIAYWYLAYGSANDSLVIGGRLCR